MTVYYTSKSGSDSNNGLGPDASHASNKPWLTLGKLLGASGIASGDTAYVGPGTYRETVTVAMTSATAETSVLGDPVNAQGFKDGSGVLLTAAEVVWTAYTTNDTTAPAASATLTLAGRDFLTFQYLTIIGGSSSPSCINGATTNSVSIVLRDCKIICSGVSSTLLTYTGLADIAANWIIDRCRMISYGGAGVVITLPTSAIADYDSTFLVQNSEFNISSANAVTVTASGAGSFKGGGVDVLNCTFVIRQAALTTLSANISTTIPCTCNNCLIIAGGGSALSATTSGQITENYNRIISASPRTNVTAGANSISDMSHAPLINLGFASQIGFAPQPYWGPMPTSPILGFGDTGAPSVDILNRPRPAGGASTSKAVGAYERHDTAVQETSVVQAGSSAAKIIGPGDHDFVIPVDASSTTISVYVRYDTNHGTGSKPQIILLANGAIGVTTETKTATVGVDTQEQLSFAAQTPSAKGFVTVRCVSRAAAGGGIAYFDTAAGGATSTTGFDYFRSGEPISALVSGTPAAGGLIGGGSVTGGTQ